MTCRYTQTDYRDVLYTCVLKAGGVVEAARYLTERRGCTIHPELLRTKLRHQKGTSISIEMAALLSEWMEEQTAGAEIANNWIVALAASRGMAVDSVPPALEGSPSGGTQAILAKLMGLSQINGALSGTGLSALSDGKLSTDETDALVVGLRELRTMAHRTERKLLRMAKRK